MLVEEVCDMNLLKKIISPKGIASSFIGTIAGSVAYQRWFSYRRRRTKNGKIVIERVRR